MGFSNTSLSYLNYPTQVTKPPAIAGASSDGADSNRGHRLGFTLTCSHQVVFQSCKLIPVLIGGVLLQRKQYVATDYIASGLLSLGLSIFTLADVKVSPQYSSIGANRPLPPSLVATAQCLHCSGRVC